MNSHLKVLESEFSKVKATRSRGKVIALQGPLIEASLPQAAIGDYCEIILTNGKRVGAEIVSFKGETVQLAPLDRMKGMSPNMCVENTMQALDIACSNELIGSVCNAFGKVISDERKIKAKKRVSINTLPPAPLKRQAIDTQLCTGISAIDAVSPIGYGQRLGLFAGAGVGKSTLLGMIARNADVDVSVIALVGERGREVNEFINDCLGEEGRRKAIVVVATSDEPALCKQMAAYTATSIAEFFRSQGKRVLLLVDSLTRTARAIREVSLAKGELPVRQGYTASVYSELPFLLERAGNDERGSITALYAVLHDDKSDPLSEEITSILDGHIYLSKELALKNIRPAIDITRSLSRVQRTLCSEEHIYNANTLQSIVNKLESEKEFLLFGGEADAALQACLDIEEDVYSFLKQGIFERRSLTTTQDKLNELCMLYKTLRETVRQHVLE